MSDIKDSGDEDNLFTPQCSIMFWLRELEGVIFVSLIKDKIRRKKYIKIIPESIASIKNLISDMNIDSYDDRILDQLLNVAFSISQELIIKSNEYTKLNSRFRIEENDAKMAISNYINSNIVNQNSFLLNKSISNEINSIPLPSFPSKGVSKIWLPPDDEMHITPGWHVNSSDAINGIEDDNNLDNKNSLNNIKKTPENGLSSDSGMNDNAQNGNIDYLNNPSNDYGGKKGISLGDNR
ncbi:hypothetical protein FG386_000175 [Cryptosporidium ryanae]|uniref:uncharacterized protein n=1 Tax=Cryptosporidium ryanae TaxID=515981 RepID=UPI00351A8599|nr:hypothetical protein FG386_000175 [Cryptosporidium ryanae]